MDQWQPAQVIHPLPQTCPPDLRCVGVSVHLSAVASWPELGSERPACACASKASSCDIYLHIVPSLQMLSRAITYNSARVQDRSLGVLCRELLVLRAGGPPITPPERKVTQVVLGGGLGAYSCAVQLLSRLEWRTVDGLEGWRCDALRAPPL